MNVEIKDIRKGILALATSSPSPAFAPLLTAPSPSNPYPPVPSQPPFPLPITPTSPPPVSLPPRPLP